MSDDREALGRLVRATWETCVRDYYTDPKPSWVAQWDDLDDFQREVDMRIGSAVAVQAVADARLRNERLELEVATHRAHLPAILGALRIALANAPYESLAKPYRTALMALRDGSDEKGADHD